ncbi:MAG: glycosyltransferase family 2 protein [Bacteroidales bacterium]|nr:glycosyltransferase family 2 protein [Bacteroidales bacterium]
MISVIVPIYNEEKYIDKCVQSIVNQDYPKDDLEVLFVDGMSTDATRSKLAAWAQQYPWLLVIDNPQRIVPPAMNIGIRAAKGDIIIRLDAHASFPTCYFSELVRYLNELQADNVGGVCRTLPIDDTPLCRSIAAVLSSPFGMGNSYFRIGSDQIRKVDTVPFGCFRRSLFDKIGYFDEQLVRNQDDEFNGRIIKNGGTIYLLPHLVIDYYARDSVRKVWSMFYQYGLFKPLVNKKLGSPATIRQFFPLAFVLGLAIGFLLTPLSIWIFWFYWLIVFIYWGLAFAIGIKTARREQCPPMSVIMPYLFFVVHCAYGIGYLNGIVNLLFHKDFKVTSRR